MLYTEDVVLGMTGDEAYVALLSVRDEFLIYAKINKFNRYATWYWGTCSFQSNPKLNEEMKLWCERSGIDLPGLRAKALKKESRAHELGY